MRVKVIGNIYRKVDNDRWVCVSELPDMFNEIEVSDTDYQDDVARKMLDLGVCSNILVPLARVEKFLSESTIILTVDFLDDEGSQSKLILWCTTHRKLYMKGSAVL